MIFFQILICAYVIFLIWDIYTIIKKDRPQWNPWIILTITTLFLVPGMYKYTLYFPFVIYILVFVLIVQAIQWLRKKPVKIWMVVLCIALSGAYVTYGYFHFQKRIEMEYSVQTEKEIDPTRILFFSDLHYPNGMNIDQLDQLVEEMKETDPDVVLIGGDLLDEQTSQSEMEESIAALKPLSEKAPVYFIYGNHDLQPKIKNKKFTQEQFEAALKEANIHILNDAVAQVDDLTIVGRADYALKNRESLQEMLADVDPNQFTVLVDHQPIDTDEVLESGKVDLMISGHTHNGQLYPFGYLLDIYWHCALRYGIQDKGDLTAITSSGVNAWGFPARTMGTSEYVVIDITHENQVD